MLEIVNPDSNNPPYWARFKMTLVAYHRDVLSGGNGYAKTTWISSNIDTATNNSNSFILWLGENAGWNADEGIYSQTSLRNVYADESKRPLSSLKSQMPYLHSALSSVIKQHVTKNNVIDMSVEKLWIPSIYEIVGDEGISSIDRNDFQMKGQELKAPTLGVNYSDFYKFYEGENYLIGRNSFINPISSNDVSIICRDSNEDKFRYYNGIICFNRQNGLGWYANKYDSSLCFCLG